MKQQPYNPSQSTSHTILHTQKSKNFIYIAYYARIYMRNSGLNDGICNVHNQKFYCIENM